MLAGPKPRADPFRCPAAPGLPDSGVRVAGQTASTPLRPCDYLAAHILLQRLPETGLDP